MRRIVLFLLPFLLLFSSCELAYEMDQPAPKVGTMRILVYGNDYSQSAGNYLGSTVNDAVQMGKALTNLAIKANMDYQITYLIGKDPSNVRALVDTSPECVTLSTDVTKTRFMAELEHLATLASETDLTIVYYAGHGDGLDYPVPYGTDVSGSSFMVLNNDSNTGFSYLAISAFMEVVSAIQGIKVVLGDFCYSGAMVPQSGVSLTSGEFLNADIDDLFWDRACISEDPSLYCLSAARYNEKSWEKSGHGYFTRTLLGALGWNEPSQCLYPTAGAEEHGCITLHNIARYVIKNDGTEKQSPMVSNASNDLILFNFR